MGTKNEGHTPLKGKRMNLVWTDMRLGLFAGTAVAIATVAHGQSVAEREIEGVDKRFAIATEYFGDGEVQFHTRKDIGTGSLHEVHTFDCNNRTYRKDYEGDTAPETFPLAGTQGDGYQLTREMEQAAMAAHACDEHGFPSLRMEW
jgi:hypothetical protein